MVFFFSFRKLFKLNSLTLNFIRLFAFPKQGKRKLLSRQEMNCAYSGGNLKVSLLFIFLFSITQPLTGDIIHSLRTLHNWLLASWNQEARGFPSSQGLFRKNLYAINYSYKMPMNRDRATHYYGNAAFEAGITKEHV